MESSKFTSIDDMSMGSNAVFPIGVKGTQQIRFLIESSNLTDQQKRCYNWVQDR